MPFPRIGLIDQVLDCAGRVESQAANIEDQCVSRLARAFPQLRDFGLRLNCHPFNLSLLRLFAQALFGRIVYIWTDD